MNLKIMRGDQLLVDSSVWINFLSGYETKASLFLKHKTSEFLLATCPIILQEVLQGIADDKTFRKVSLELQQLVFLQMPDEYELAFQAAGLYRSLRKKGITIRKANDCLIACYAIDNHVALLTEDRDFNYIAKHTSLNLVL